jgi:drug/metabolite transporter (DMT)-like permease
MLYLIVVSVVWAFSFPLIKLHLTTLDSNFVALARMVLALLVLLPFLRLRRLSAALALRLAAIGALQMGVMYVAYIRSFQYLQSYEVALLTILTPLWITLFSSVLTRRLTLRFHLGALLAIAGAAVIVARQEALGPALTGVALVQVSNVAFGFGQILYKRAVAVHPAVRSHEVFALLYAGAVAVTLVATVWTFEPAQFEITTTQVIVLAYLGIVASGIGFLLWNLGATRVGVGTLAVMNNGYMPLAVLTGLLWLGEEANLVRLVVGTALILTALLVARPANVPEDTSSGSGGPPGLS